MSDRSYYERNRERILERNRAHRWANIEKVRMADRARHQRNREKRIAGMRVYQAKNKDRLREQRRQYRLKNPEKRRAAHLAYLYALTTEQYDAMLAAQGGVCAICGGVDRRALSVDHDHNDGRVRGLLCVLCNKAIGHARDNPELLEKMAQYLRRLRVVEARSA